MLHGINISFPILLDEFLTIYQNMIIICVKQSLNLWLNVINTFKYGLLHLHSIYT